MRERIRVLLGDRSASIRLLLRSLLESDDRFEVVADASTGRELLQRLDGVELAVLDLVLDDEDGFTVLETIRSARPDVPVVIYSEFDPPYMRAEAQARGAAGYFSKSQDPTEAIDGFAAIVDARRSG